LHLPIAVVSSLRETSVLFALLIGVIFLKEKITLQKVFVIFIILFGIMVLRLT
jgi:drug/metabolite transporter (DMT)-like permease